MRTHLYNRPYSLLNTIAINPFPNSNLNLNYWIELLGARIPARGLQEVWLRPGHPQEEGRPRQRGVSEKVRRITNRQTSQPTTDIGGHREVTLPIGYVDRTLYFLYKLFINVYLPSNANPLHNNQKLILNREQIIPPLIFLEHFHNTRIRIIT